VRRPAALGNYRRFSCAYPATGGCCNAADIVRSRVAIPYSGYTVFISLCYACSTVVSPASAHSLGAQLRAPSSRGRSFGSTAWHGDGVRHARAALQARQLYA
jgi:hypothetical protein